MQPKELAWNLPISPSPVLIPWNPERSATQNLAMTKVTSVSLTQLCSSLSLEEVRAQGV
jgi:hypothetical protein